MWVKWCRACWRLDLRERYANPDEAVAAGVLERPWACPHCGRGDGFELIADPHDRPDAGDR